MFSMYLPRRRCTVLGLTLMIVWFAGVSLGLLAARSFGDPFGAMLLNAASLALPFGNAFLVTVLPLFFSAFAVFFFHRFGAYLACGLRGLSIGFVMGLSMAAGGIWLCALLLFSVLSFSPVLLWYLWRSLDSGAPGLCPDGLYCLLAGTIIAAVDTWVVAPFLVAALSS